MRRLYSKFFICEGGHITVGDGEKSKCEANEFHLGYVKGKKKGKWNPEVKETKKCGKKIIETKEIPESLDFKTIWDSDVMHAFLLQQTIDAEFMIDLQSEFKQLWEKVNAKDGS